MINVSKPVKLFYETVFQKSNPNFIKLESNSKFKNTDISIDGIFDNLLLNICQRFLNFFLWISREMHCDVFADYIVGFRCIFSVKQRDLAVPLFGNVVAGLFLPLGWSLDYRTIDLLVLWCGKIVHIRVIVQIHQRRHCANKKVQNCPRQRRMRPCVKNKMLQSCSLFILKWNIVTNCWFFTFISLT